MKKTVWIINHYAGDTFFDKGGRHYWFAKYLAKSNYNPVVFCCNNKHNPGTEKWINTNELWEEKLEKDINVPYVFVRACKYCGNGMQRILNMYEFYANMKIVAEQYVNKYRKPDVIIASSVHPLTLIVGIKLARKYNIKCICEIRDLWPETLVAYGLISKRNFIIVLLRLLEKWTYKNADRLVFTMKGGYDYICAQGWQHEISKTKIRYVNNGVDLAEFNYNKETYKVDFEELNDNTVFKVVYAGSIRQVNNVGKLLDVAKLLVDKKIVFLIFGKGDKLEELMDRVNRESINNVVFMGAVEKKYIPDIVSHADLNYAHNSESNIFKYGISFNKIFEYFAAGKPILTDFACAYNPVLEENAGVSVVSGDIQEIASAIEKMANLNNNDYAVYCKNSLKAAKKYDFKRMTDELENIIMDCLTDNKK